MINEIKVGQHGEGCECPHCGAGNDAHHSYSCPTGKHPDRSEEFQTEYFSGLNWREAEKLVGKVVEFSDEPDADGWSEGVLENLDYDQGSRFGGQCGYFEYIRTCPETHAHPTITISGVELPRPETEEPEYGTPYWMWKPTKTEKFTWAGCETDRLWLKSGVIHLTKDRAQAWADWWDETVQKKRLV